MSVPPSAPHTHTEDGDIIVVKIFESLRDSIVSGAITPGSLIDSVTLAQQFGTSRTPIREALFLLSQYGLVTLTARRRPRVSTVTAQGIRDLYALRAALHAYISEAVVQHSSDQQLEALRDHAHQLIAEFDQLSTEAHLQAVEHYLASEAHLARNNLVLEVLDTQQWRIAWFRRLGAMSREQLATLARDRLRAAEAYVERDALLAKAINRSMLKKADAYCEHSFLQSQDGVPL